MATPKQVSEVSALKYQVLELQCRELQRQINDAQALLNATAKRGSAHVAEMRQEVGAGPTDRYDPRTKTFVKIVPAAKAPQKGTTTKVAKR